MVKGMMEFWDDKFTTRGKLNGSFIRYDITFVLRSGRHCWLHLLSLNLRFSFAKNLWRLRDVIITSQFKANPILLLMLGVTSEGLRSSQAAPEPQLPTIPAPASPCRRPSQSPSLRHWDHTCGPMQHSPEDLKRRLLACIDEDCNVSAILAI